MNPINVPPIKQFDFDHYKSLLGILSGGYYCHNLSVPMLRNAANQDKNLRDLFLGFFAVFLSYCICGIFGYIGFQNLAPNIE